VSVRLGSGAGLIAFLCAIAPPTTGTTLADDKGKVVKERILPARVFKDKDRGKVKEAVKAIEKLPSVKIIPHSDATPHLLVEFDTSKVDVGDLAKAIASVKTAGAKEDTAAFLMVYVELSGEEQAAILRALTKVNGVNAKKSEATGERLLIALDNGGGAKLSEVLEALKSAAPKK
jgi:hypothetical protein